MKIIIEKNYEGMSQVVRSILLGEMYQDRRVNLSITAGSTPVRLYELLVNDIKDKPYFDNVHFYNFDEINLKGEEGYGVTMRHLNRLFFTPANIASENIHVLDSHNYQGQDKRIKQDGGLDLILMGIGLDGHFCGNLPGTTQFEDLTSKIARNATPDLEKGLLAEVGGDEKKCPDFYVTMGPKSVMQARRIILFANGKKKARIIQQAFFGKVTNDVPSSILQLHPNITLVLDEEAASDIVKSSI